MTSSASRADPPEAPRPNARRRWSEEEKRRIVTEAEAPGASVSVVARRHDLNANLLFNWRRQFRREACSAGGSAAFIPAVIAPDESGAAGEPAETPREHGEAIAIKDKSAPRPPGLIEIILPGGRRVIVDKEVSAPALGRVISVLERQ